MSAAQAAAKVKSDHLDVGPFLASPIRDLDLGFNFETSLQ